MNNKFKKENLIQGIRLLLFSCEVISDFCNPINCSTLVLPVPHYLLEFAQVHFHLVSDPIQPSHPLLPSPPFALNLSQHQGFFQ